MENTDYELLIGQAEALIQGVPHLVANLANVSALIFTTLEDINWAGFYLLEGDKLVLGPFQGNPACVEISIGKGVCGTAAAKDAVQLVPDVHLFEGHIACDTGSRRKTARDFRSFALCWRLSFGDRFAIFSRMRM